MNDIPGTPLVQQITVAPTASIRAALRAIDRGGVGAAVLADTSNGRFIALLTDGDIRRGLINNDLSLDSAIADVSHPATRTASADSSPAELTALFSDEVRLVPLLDDAGRCVDLAQFDRRVRLPISEPALLGRELEYVTDCVLSGWISSAGSYVTEFEKLFGAFVETKHAVTASNGTTALHLALLALEIGPGDEVIVPSLSFIASANAVRHAGATPVFVDSDPGTWNIDVDAIEDAIGPRTRAIMPVHLYGQPADMDSIMTIARRHKLAVIEDAAEAHGAKYKGRPVGSIGDIATFSFYGNKIITTGEGGMVTTNRADLAARVRMLRDHGMSPERRYWHPILGYNYRLTNLQAAIGVAQMERVDILLQEKERIRAGYTAGLAGLAGLALQQTTTGAEPVCWLFSMTVDESRFGCSRDELAAKLALEHVESRPLFVPMHRQPVYESALRLPVSERLSATGISLPSATGLTSEAVARVCETIARAHAVGSPA